MAKLLLSFVLLLAAPLALVAQTLGAVRVGTGLSLPVMGATAPGAANASNIYIVQQGGTISTFNTATNTVSGTPFFTQNATLTPGFVNGGEQGLLGLAFHPNYESNNHFYTYYTGNSGNSLVVDQYTRNPTTGAIGNRINVISVPHTVAGNHNGGWIGFKPGDIGNNLYINTGDGGGANDTPNNAQNTNVLLGKILRLDVGNGIAATGGYTNPAGNMTINPNPAIPQNPSNLVRGEIYAYGLRNPFRGNFDRGDAGGNGRGNLFFGDVGQGAREEVNFIASNRVNTTVLDQTQGSQNGINFGWRLREGFIATPSGGVGGNPPLDNVNPIADYPQSGGPVISGASVIGGQVYRGPATDGAGSALLNGTYIFSDFFGAIASLRYDPLTGVTSEFVNRRPEIDASLAGTGTFLNAPSAWIENTSGTLYVLDYNDGEVYRIVPIPEPTLLLPLAVAFVAFHRNRKK